MLNNQRVYIIPVDIIVINHYYSYMGVSENWLYPQVISSISWRRFRVFRQMFEQPHTSYHEYEKLYQV